MSLVAQVHGLKSVVAQVHGLKSENEALKKKVKIIHEVLGKEFGNAQDDGDEVTMCKRLVTRVHELHDEVALCKRLVAEVHSMQREMHSDLSLLQRTKSESIVQSAKQQIVDGYKRMMESELPAVTSTSEAMYCALSPRAKFTVEKIPSHSPHLRISPRRKFASMEAIAPSSPRRAPYPAKSGAWGISTPSKATIQTDSADLGSPSTPPASFRESKEWKSKAPIRTNSAILGSQKCVGG
jgi:hypothetical protein